MENNQNNQNNKPKDGDKKPKINLLIPLIVSVALMLGFFAMFNFVRNSQYDEKTLDDFLSAKEAGQLAEVEIHLDRIIYLTREEAAKPAQEQRACYAGLTIGANAYALATELHEAGVKVDQEIVEDNSMIMNILTTLLMFVLLFGGMTLLGRRMSGDGMMGAMGASKAKVYMEKETGVTFKIGRAHV